MMKTPIAILTDFGIADPYVGIMKGVIAGICPDHPIIDLTHEIPPGDIHRAAVTLWQSIPYFPVGTVFLSVVDPGVGTQRLPVILKTQGYTFVGPDNGSFTYILKDDSQAWIISNPNLGLANPSKTFHGRDIFAPAAAHAASGVQASEFGDEVENLKVIPFPRLEYLIPGFIEAEILYSDRFGNALTSLGTFKPVSKGQFIFRPWVGSSQGMVVNLEDAILEIPGREHISFASTFTEIAEEQCAIIVGSSGLIEIVSNQASATERLNLVRGETIRLMYPLNNHSRSHL